MGYASAVDFVSAIAKGYTAIYPRAGRSLDLVVDGDERGLLIVQLEPDATGDFYDVRTATPIRRDQYRRKSALWEKAGPSRSSEISDPLHPKGQGANGNIARSDRSAKKVDGNELFQREMDGKGDATVATLTGDELGPWADIRQLGKKAEAWYRENLVGTSVVHQGTGWTIQFNATGARKTSGRKGDVLYRSVPALKQILARGRLIESAPDERGRAEIKAVHKIRAAIVLDGKTVDLIATVREAIDGTFHYDLSRSREDGVRSFATPTVLEQASTSALEGDPDGLNLALARPDVNADPVITPARAQAINAAAARALDEAGLLGKVGLRVEDGRIAGPLGRYERGVVSILRDGPRDWRQTLDHEIIHALRDAERWGASHGLFMPGEWRALVAAARQDVDLVKAVNVAYRDKPASVQTEEMVAEFYANWAAGRREADGGPLRRALETIRAFFRAAASALRGEGFVDAARIMERIARGRIGGRGPDGPGGAHHSARQARGEDGRFAGAEQRGDATATTISEVIAAAQRSGHAPEKAETGRPAAWVVAAAEDAGVPFGRLRHVIDGSAVRHIFKNHGNAKTEAARGQVAITDADIIAVSSVLSDPDAVAVGGKTNMGPAAVIYAKVMPDGTTILVEELRTAKNEAAVKTMRKMRSAAKDDKALERLLLSNARSDDGTAIKVAFPPQEIKDQRDLSAFARRAGLSDKGRAARGWFGRQGWKDAPALASAALTDAMGRYERLNTLALVPGRALFAELGKRLKAVGGYMRAKEEMDAERNAWRGRADETARAWLHPRAALRLCRGRGRRLPPVPRRPRVRRGGDEAARARARAALARGANERHHSTISDGDHLHGAADPGHLDQLHLVRAGGDRRTHPQ